MDEQEKEELIQTIDDLLDNTREGRAVKGVVESLPTDHEAEVEPPSPDRRREIDRIRRT